MRVASFNVENLFSRVSALNDDTAKNKRVMNDVVRLQELICKAEYTPDDKVEMKKILERNNVEQERKRNFFIQQVRGKLYTASKQHPPGKTVISKISVDGRDDWDGWIDFDRQVFDSAAIENTARAIAEINADVL